MKKHPKSSLARRVAVAALVALIAAAGGASAPAEIIELKNGRQIEGVIIEEADGRVKVLTSQGVHLDFPAEAIVSVSAPAGSDPTADRLDVFLGSGQFVDVIQLLEPIVAGDNDRGVVDCARRRALVRTILARRDAIDQYMMKEAGPRKRRLYELIEGVFSPWGEGGACAGDEGDEGGETSAGDGADVLSGSTRAHYRVMLSRLAWLRLGDAPAALGHLAAIAPEWLGSPGADTAARAAADLCLELLWQQQRMREPELAATALRLLERFDDNAWRAAGAVYHLRQGAMFRQSGDYARAIATYDGPLRDFAPHHADLRVLESLQDAEQQLAAAASWDLLIELMQRYGPDAMTPPEYDDAMRRIYERAGRDAFERRDLDTASAYFTALRGLRAEGADELITLASLAAERELLDPDNDFGRYQLARRYLEHGFLDEAEALFRGLEDRPEFAANVAGQLGYIGELRQQRHYNLVNAALAEQRYYDTLDYAMEFLEFYPDSQLVDPIRKMADTARTEIANERVRRPMQARILIDNARRAAYLHSYQEALDLLDRVLTEYPDTPSVEEAEAEKRIVLDRIYARGFDEYLRQRQMERGTFDRFLGGGAASATGGAVVPQGVRDEIHFIVSTIGSRLPDDAFGGGGGSGGGG